MHRPEGKAWAAVCREASVEKPDQVLNGAMAFNRMPERAVAADGVSIPPTNPFALDEASQFEVQDDPLNGALGDADAVGHLPEHDRGIAKQKEEHMTVIAKKGPAAGDFRRCPARRPRLSVGNRCAADAGPRASGGRLRPGVRRGSLALCHEAKLPWGHSRSRSEPQSLLWG